MDDLLIKYILEEATPEESNQVQQWLAENTANQVHFEKLQAAWRLASQQNLPQATEPSLALQRLKQTVHAKETAPIKRIWLRVWPAAAIVVGMAGVALGAYVYLKPKNSVKEHPSVVQPDTAQQKPVRSDTVPAVLPTPALNPDTIPVVKPHKKKRALPVKPVQRVHPKKKVATQPTQPADTIRIKRKHALPAQAARPAKKRKTPTAPKAPVAPAKEPPIS